MAGESQIQSFSREFIEKWGKGREETCLWGQACTPSLPETCLPIRKNSGNGAGMGRACLLKGPFAPALRLLGM